MSEILTYAKEATTSLPLIAGSAAEIDLVRLTTQAATLRNLCHGDPRGSTSSDDQAACGANVAIPTTGAFR